MKKITLILLLCAALTSCKSNLDHAIEHANIANDASKKALMAMNDHQAAIKYLEVTIKEEKESIKYLEKFLGEWMTTSGERARVLTFIETLNGLIRDHETMIQRRKRFIQATQKSI